MKNIEKLWELQQQEDLIIQIEKDVGITDIKNEISNFKISYNKILSTIKELAEEYKEKEIMINELKLEIAEINNKIVEDEEKLYNGSIKKVKALTQMQKEIDDFKSKFHESHEMIDQYKKENLSVIRSIKKYKAKSELIKERISQCEDMLIKKAQDIKDQLADINNNIEIIKSFLTPEEIKFYFDKKDNLYPVVVCYKEDVCEGCKMQFSLIFSQTIKKNEKNVFTCENCGRLIYIPELQEA